LISAGLHDHLHYHQAMARRPQGSLEAAALQYLSLGDSPRTVQEVGEAIDPDLAYTSVATVLTRLVEKGHAYRHRVGRSFRYTAAVSPDELSAQLMRRVLSAASDPSSAISGFVRSLSPEEIAILREVVDNSDSTRGGGGF
jgi:predicted transcriptional regulator